MASVGTSDYTLAISELGAIQALLRFQQQFGLNTPAATIATYFSGLDSLLAAYPQIQNTLIKGWFDAMLTYANSATTVDADTPVPVLHMMVHYSAFCNRDVVLQWRYTNPPSGNWVTCWEAFVNGREVLYDCQNGGLWNGTIVPRLEGNSVPVGPWVVPVSPTIWQTTVKNRMTAWGLNPPSQYIANFDERFQVNCCIVLIDNGCHMYMENAAHCTPNWANQATINNSWTGVGSAGNQTATAAAATELTCVKTLLAADSLTADAYFFILHSLIALSVTTAGNQSLAQTIVQTVATSPEYPNDSFANQLIYLSLMFLADPLGSYAMTNKDLQVLMANLSTLIAATDAASTALRLSLSNHLKILVADSAYPMQDPYCPATGFNTRVSDTLAALDAARATIKATLAS